MNELHLSLVLEFGLGLVAGFALGAVHFGSLWWNTRMFARSGSLVPAFVVQACRFGLLVAVLVVLSKFGALPLLSGALGLLVARQMVVKRVGTVG